MKKVIILMLVLAIAAMGVIHYSDHGISSNDALKKSNAILAAAEAEIIPDGLSEDEVISYSKEAIAVAIKDNLWSDDFIVDVDTQLVSKEYLKSLEANSRENVFFGFTDSELREIFGTDMVVFRLDENGQTTVVPYEAYANPYIPAIKDFAIGASVVLICVTVTLATGGGVAPVAHAVFAAAAKGGAKYAISGGLLSGTANAIITLIQTGDLEQAKDKFINSGAQAFKIGAFMGAAASGISKAISIKRAGIPTWRESELEAQRQFGGEEQVAFKNGERVASNEPLSTRPDLVRELKDGSMEAIEVKNYNFANPQSKSELLRECVREVSDRSANLPDGFSQRIVLDTRGRGFTRMQVENMMQQIKDACAPFCNNLAVSQLAY